MTKTTPSKAVLTAWGALFAETRESLGLKQTAVALRAGLDQARVSRAERGTASLATVMAIADALAISFSRLAEVAEAVEAQQVA